jgi:hypothetical protein
MQDFSHIRFSIMPSTIAMGQLSQAQVTRIQSLLSDKGATVRAALSEMTVAD